MQRCNTGHPPWLFQPLLLENRVFCVLSVVNTLPSLCVYAPNPLPKHA